MKLIFLDADGTLFHPMGYIPKSSFQAIAQAQKNGHKIVLCTGRQKAEIYGDLEKIDYDGMVLGSGCLVMEKDRVLSNIVFDENQKEMLIDYFDINNIPCIYESNEHIYCTYTVIEKIDELLKELYPNTDYTNTGLYKTRQALTIIQQEDIQNIEFNKITFLESKIPYKETYLGMKDYFDIVPCTFAPFGQESGEISNPKATKATGMDILIQHFHINEQDVIAIGDGYNDLPMFKRAHTSVAMGNAPDDIKKICDYVCEDIDHDGIFDAFKKLNILSL